MLAERENRTTVTRCPIEFRQYAGPVPGELPVRYSYRIWATSLTTMDRIMLYRWCNTNIGTENTDWAVQKNLFGFVRELDCAAFAVHWAGRDTLMDK